MKRIYIPLLAYFFISIASAAPDTLWYLDELGTVNYSYVLDDAQGLKDGIAYTTPSTGNATGKICSALDFTANSTSDYALLDESSLHGATNFTISFWHKGTSNTGKAALSGARANQDNALMMWFTTNGTRFHGYLDGAAGPAFNFPSITDNQWHHLVWRRSGNQSCFFTDGIQRGCEDVTPDALNIESLVLGQDQDNVGGAFNIDQDWEALVDEFLIYRSALTNAEITTLYNHQNAGNDWNGAARACQTVPPALPPQDYGYSDWHFDEDSWNGTPNEVVDSQGGQHGTGFGVSAVPGKLCNAIDLSNSSTQDYAQLGAGSLDGVGDFTISVWHKGTSVNGRSLLSGAVAGSINELIMWFNPDTRFNGHLKNSALGAINTTSIANNNWHHLVWRRLGAQSCFFFDTQLQGCQPNTTSTNLSVTSLILGQEQDALGGNFDANQDWEGIVDELIIFRRALDNATINSIYTNQNNGRNWDGSHRFCPNMPAMKLTKISAVISDPVNLNINPKRIPGAIIRYTISAENAHATAAEGVVIRDDLSSEVTSGSINWIGNIQATSPNINAGITQLLTDIVDADEGQFTNNIVSVNCGNITDSSPCVVSYDIEVAQ